MTADEKNKIAEIKKAATEILHATYGENASFREGQYEAIEATAMGRRTLVVQRTGWGKSLVYFICAKILRSQNKGVTMVVSPLIVLMENQREMAEKMNLKCDILNSTTRDRRAGIIDELIHNKIDVIFVTPETLFADDVQSLLPAIKVGLFVIDEAHCISDWGHDFRLEYGRLGRIVSNMPSNVAVLAVTATANDRVVNDLKRQLGDNVAVSRGPLTRESLHIQVLKLDNRAKRYGWLLENLSKLPGTGIIYCLTRNDCKNLSDFLNMYGLQTMPYFSGNDNYKNNEAIYRFQHNKIKAIVATIKLGMGYDKGDISFVIHYQSPSNIVSYYQQIGRAGRNIPDAYAFLMTGGYEDEMINQYFIDSAFPTERESRNVYDTIANSEGISLSGIEGVVNCKRTRILKTLDFLKNDGLIRREEWNYYASPKPYFYDKVRYRTITKIRKTEMQQMKSFASAKRCYSRFAVNCLDDPEKHNCGKCSNCTGEHIYPGLSLHEASVKKAEEYINAQTFAIEPRLKWPNYSSISYVNEEGICLSKYGVSGFGELVREGREITGFFADSLVDRAYRVLKDLVRREHIGYVAFVPSLRSDGVRDFAVRLARRLNIACVDLLAKHDAPPQKEMLNNAHQCENAMKSFFVRRTGIPERVLLVDDTVDSRWTLTVCGYKLMDAGCYRVYPFALADSSEAAQ